MTEHIPPGNGSIPHRVARLEADVSALRDRVDRAVVRLFIASLAIMFSLVATLVTTILYR